MRKLLFLFLSLISVLSVQAQTNLDSLYSTWHNANIGDSIRVEAFVTYIEKGFSQTNKDSAIILAKDLFDFGITKGNIIAQVKALNIQGHATFSSEDQHKSIMYFKQGMELSKKINDLNGIANTYDRIGKLYYNIYNVVKALDYYARALEIREKIGDQHEISKSLQNLGFVYTFQGSYGPALQYYHAALEIEKQIGSTYAISYAKTNLAGVYNHQGSYSKALEYFNEALEYFNEIKNNNRIQYVSYHIGDTYKNLGNYTQALEFTLKSLNAAELIGSKLKIAHCYNQLGKIYTLQKKTNEALLSFNKGLEIYEQQASASGRFESLNGIGILFNQIEEYSKALNYCLMAYEIALSINLLTQQSGCECAYYSYKGLGNTGKALKFHELLVVLNDSLNKEETAEKMQQIQFKKEMKADSIAKAEEASLVQFAHQEEVRKGEKTRNILGGVGILILILAGGLYGRVRYIRKSKVVLQVEKDRSENLLLNILPADIAAELKEKGRAEARDFEMVSILFTDFKGFTEASAKLSAQDLVSELNTCFESFDGIMGKYKIEKIKTIGDAYMAVGGLPVPSNDSVKNTVLAALEMQAFISKRKKELDAAGKPAFEMRVGIHTGPVVAGIVGVKKFQYDIWGDTVNTAARMESSGEVEKVNISQSTYELLKDDPEFSFESRGKIEAKGKGEIEMYFVSKA